MIKQLSSIISRILFIASFLIVGITIWEKLANRIGFTLTRGYFTNWELLEFSALALIFLIALQLREIKISLEARNK